MRYSNFYFDETYILIIIGMVLCLLASAMVKSTYAKYEKMRTLSGITGKEAAELILRREGIYDVSVEHVHGKLSDHYDPRSKVVRLSDSTYSSASVAAVGVAAHECGHALQHAKGYVPLQLRSTLVPVANIGSKIAWPLILIGFFIQSSSSNLFIQLGIIAFTAAVLFQVVTLPVEFNASSRAMGILKNEGILQSGELKYAKKVLNAAALTYVAAAAASMLQLLRIILLAKGRRRND